MTRFSVPTFLILILAFAAGCSNDQGTAGDSANPNALDNNPSPGRDAGNTQDTAPPVQDAGAEDSGGGDDVGMDTSVDDASTDTDQVDTAPDVPDVLEQRGVIPNWSFEDWSADNPDHWGGDTTQLYDFSRVQGGHTGQSAIRLANAEDRHQRFSTSPLALQAGVYACSIAARGAGEVRIGHHINEDYADYTAYTSLTDEWQTLTYDFSVSEDAAADFELILSVRNTAPAVEIDSVECNRMPSPCDDAVCEEWQVCREEDGTCELAPGRCELAEECEEWQTCDTDARACVTSEGRCESTADCDVAGDTPRCELGSRTCVAGDPCEGVTCQAWEACVPDTGTCALAEGRCVNTFNCQGALPACDTETNTCVGVEHEANLIPNGGWERWNTRDLPFYPQSFAPAEWWDTYEDLTDQTGHTEIDPADLIRYEPGRTGQYALQMQQLDVAERFTTEDFTAPGGSYACQLWVKGRGGVRVRWYSKLGWGPMLDRSDIDSPDDWQRITFSMDLASQAREFRMILYTSFTDADADHIIIDDFVCTK